MESYSWMAIFAFYFTPVAVLFITAGIVSVAKHLINKHWYYDEEVKHEL